ncbi:hypothetical protein BDB01DRAFT_719995 [Pilobolus umbonatus]|nr:hypothetical protein BDB01DRAFT_719995 [Pilobolus umbonatus]
MEKNGYKEVPTSASKYEQDRLNLLDGYVEPVKYDSSGQEDLYSQSRLAEDKHHDDETQIETIKGKIRDLKHDTLESTRNALRKINEAESAATNTMSMLGTQSAQIANVERQLDLSKAYSDKAASQASELKQLNKSIFIPVVKNPFTKGKREKKELENLQKSYREHKDEREDIRQFEYASNMRVEDTMRKANAKSQEGIRSGRSQHDRNKYQFEADAEDDAMEDEIDQNLDLLGDVTSKLKAMSVNMSEELNSQNKQLNKINKKVDPINEKLMSTTFTLNSTK